MYWLHTESYLQLQVNYEDMWIFLAAVIFKSLFLKMAATVTTVEFGIIQHYPSLEDNSEVCLCSSLNRFKKKKKTKTKQKKLNVK